MGIGNLDQKTILFSRCASPNAFQLSVSLQANHFKFLRHPGEILTPKNKKEKIDPASSFRLSRQLKTNFLCYQSQTAQGPCLKIAISPKLLHWRRLTKLKAIQTPAVLVPDYQFSDKFVLFYGRQEIKLAFTENFQDWELDPQPVFKLDTELTQGGRLEIAQVYPVPRGLLIVYFFSKDENGQPCRSLRTAYFDSHNPRFHLVKEHRVIWQPDDSRQGKITPVGVDRQNNLLVSYWLDTEKRLLAFTHPGTEDLWAPPAPKSSFPFLERFRKNPLLKPLSQHPWESEAVFNPAALLEKDKVHLVYRAVGKGSFQSFWGYAASRDGLQIQQRLARPIFRPGKSFSSSPKPSFRSLKFISGGRNGGGGGNGGFEDPRLTRIGNKIYAFFVSYNGWSEPRLAMTSIDTEDFLRHRWSWQPPVMVSRPGEIDKSGCLLPEKIKGKYVIFHRVFPDILVDFVNNLDFDGRTWLKGEYRIRRRPDNWDSRKIGLGPPPLKTPDGWLAIYNAVDDLDSGLYKMGAMLLDLNDPTKVLFRSNRPILEAETPYENHGLKYGVAYTCGAVIHRQNLLVYYGGSDQFVCVAQAPVGDFLEKLKRTGTSPLRPSFQKVKLTH